MRNGMLKVSLMAVGLGIFSGFMLFLVYGRSSSQTPGPRIIIAEQTGSPLLVLSNGVDSSNVLEPHYWYSVTNNSDKPISAYAIQERVSLGPGTPILSTAFVHLPAEQLLLRPHVSKQEDGGVGKAYAKAPIEITISVDFIEFADGSRWGVDVGKSGERLDGQRAGGKAATKKYREVLDNKGIQGLELALTNANLIKPESERQSVDWQDGFNVGVNIVKSRLARAKLKDGPEGIKSELDKPFDSREGRREP